MWYKTESNTKPTEVDTDSSRVYNYARRNIVEEQRDGVTVYTYEEVKIPKEQWHLYEQGKALEAENSAMNDMMLSLVEVIDSL